MIPLGFIVASLCALAAANPVARNMVVHEQRDTIPRGFVAKGSAAADTQVNLRIALVQNNIASLEQVLYDVSTPGSELYGQHLTKEEVEEYVKPSAESVSKVQEWLTSNGLTAKTISPAGDWLSLSIPVQQANSLLDADFTTFYNAETDIETVRTLSYSIPSDLKGHINLVHPTITFPGPRLRPTVTTPNKISLTSDAVPASCESTVTPTCIQDLYGIPSTPAQVSTNQIAVSGFIDQFPNDADLSTFLANFRTDIPSSTVFTLQEIDAGKDPQNRLLAGDEADLDVQYTIGIATLVPTTFISVGNDFQDGDLEGFLDIINFLLGETNPPQVLTTSYGQDEDTISQALAVELCNAYMQLGARGVSILFASGDSGVGASSGTCTTFVPQFPSGCPFMTSVGATQGTTETSASFSSGGFSNYFTQPSYQSSAVSSYLSFLGSTNAGLFNTTGRAFPDVSAQGQNVEIVNKGFGELVGGTSCSSPIFTSVIALLNDELAQAGKPPLGFLNPFLYGVAASALNDITTGDNPGCGTNGFPATTGWDPVTGLGTPNYAALKTAAGL